MSGSKSVPIGDSMPKGLAKTIYERAQQQTPSSPPQPKPQSGGDKK